ncbi:hypothetical protein SPICUR_04020 [Spiribacter curvatus]|uniref:DUF2249 domain-containing protein n=1 Tax=Spiribacter curvatus TaxID=1335757 RepID=U5T3F0_9GAMM|nr:DUF2249 domain-containing protein [Spiribacter curvatus]AGY91791.1 hypothetical protein SPICUR_04020 [Spiribacter curvatus]
MGADYPGGVIDLRLHRPQTRLMLVEQTLAALRPNEDILLVFRERPAHLPGHIHSRYPARFEISPVDEGPEVWSLRVHPLGHPQ